MEPKIKVPQLVLEGTLINNILEAKVYELCSKGYITQEERTAICVDLDFEYLWLELEEDTTDFTVKVIWDTYYALPQGIDDKWFRCQMDPWNPEECEEDFEEFRTEVPRILRHQGNEELAREVERLYDHFLGNLL